MTKTNQQQISLKNKREEKKNQSCSSIMLWPQIDNSQKGINLKPQSILFVTWTMNIFISKSTIMTRG